MIKYNNGFIHIFAFCTMTHPNFPTLSLANWFLVTFLLTFSLKTDY